MMDFEELKLYLPKYLSTASDQKLFEDLKSFPENIDDRIFSNLVMNENIVYQGDGFEDFLVINLPDPKIEKAKVVIFSNTCDIDIANERIYSSSICYAPIINLEKYVEKLYARNFDPQRITQFVQSVKKQMISTVFYLPVCEKLSYDSFVFLDKINSCSGTSIPRLDLNNKRLFTLSNYGLYLFLFKLSVHFSRIREGIDRN